jgi:dCMP deaminase
MMCAKMIHHAGIVKVMVVEGGYAGENGVQYLEQHGVLIETVEGPRDPRAAAPPT